MPRWNKCLLVTATVVVACFVFSPLVFSKDHQAQVQTFADSPNYDEWTKRGDDSRCHSFCKDARCLKMRSADEDDDYDHGEDRHTRCQPICLERKHCDGLMVNPQYTAIASGGAVQFMALNKDPREVTWSATVGTIDADGYYIAPSVSQSTIATLTAMSKKDPSESASATIHVVAPGRVSATVNPQVALYTISPGAAAKVSVHFGPDTNYGLRTWAQPAPPDGGAVSLFVAGMKAITLYHMRAEVRFSDGSQFTDADQIFETGALTPTAQTPAITAITTPGRTPQSGVELLDLVSGGPGKLSPPVLVTDLDGNTIWTYYAGLPVVVANPVKLLPNGHFLINFSDDTVLNGGNSVLQEVDLTGTVIWQMTAADLNAALAEASCAGCNITVLGTHHDFAVLPNGHLILIASTERDISGTASHGDVIIDLDQNHKPVWLWNEFDHLDVTRHPMGYSIGRTRMRSYTQRMMAT